MADMMTIKDYIETAEERLWDMKKEQQAVAAALIAIAKLLVETEDGLRREREFRPTVAQLLPDRDDSTTPEHQSY